MEFIHVSESNERYHYVDCGLDNIWLVGGVERTDTPYGPATAIHDLEHLHHAIAMDIIASPQMNADEFRFLRMELDLSQAALATLLRTKVQQIHRWENGKSKIPGPAQIAISSYYTESKDPDSRMKDLLDRLAEIDSATITDETRLFELCGEHWTPHNDPVAA